MLLFYIGGKMQNLSKSAFTLAEGATHVVNWDNSRKIAFTLAEVLITLGIIGVVAALTLPTVINNVHHKELETALKKQYSTCLLYTSPSPRD